LDTSVSAAKKDGKLLIIMNDTIDKLRKEFWKVIMPYKKQRILSDCDVSIALGILEIYPLFQWGAWQLGNFARIL